ncbi:cysteine hydrolase [Allopusillimonas ginsengisoli]|uniref:cysteine hydrolase n=1 Tax=Allopusillimonas ginsengisoli TaxID=453575 RepID=UPI0039C2B187
MSQSIHLLVIDPQNDFCDLPENMLPADPLKPSQGRLRPQLPVAGAHQDMLRLARFIERCACVLTDITVTLDSHQHVGIERPAFWVQKNGEPVAPFTKILASDVRAGEYRPRNRDLSERVLAYLDSLEEQGRYTHMVWPAHCEIGSWGHNVHAEVRRAYNLWEIQTQSQVHKIMKGTNPLTEHYSAIMAEVVDPDDPATGLNHALLARLSLSDMLIIAGEAGSHCAKATTEHLLEYLPIARPECMVLLTDCMSPVMGFESEYQAFIDGMHKKGLRMANSVELAHALGA